MEDAAYTTAYTRRRPLHTCGIAVLAIAHIICARTLGIYGPLGSLTRTLADRGSFLNPTIHALLCYLLAFLSIIDDHLLAVMMITSSRFPSCYRVLDLVDSAVFLVEQLPEKLDGLMNRIPLMLHRVPLLEQAVFWGISWLNWMIVVLTIGALKNTKEKESEADSYSMAENEEFSSAGKVGGDDDQKGSRRRRRMRWNSASQDHGGEEKETGIEESLYPILQLFEEGWQTPRARGSFMLSSNSNL